MEIKKYVSLPVEIEAIQFTGEMDNRNHILAWIGSHDGEATWFPEIRHSQTGRVLRIEHLKLFTLEGTMTTPVGHWIIRGTKGEFYPCDPEVFATKYAEPKPKIEIHINEPAPRRREYLEYYD